MQCDQSEYAVEGDETDECIVEYNKYQCRAAKVVLDAIRKRLKENETNVESIDERRNACHWNVTKEKKKAEFLEKTLEFWLLMHLVSDLRT